MAEIKDYSVTADDNNSASPNGMPENMAPSGVNNSWRESFARVKRWYEDINATKSTTGSSNAYVLAAARTVTAYAQGDAYMFRANHANTGAATLNIDSVGAVAIVNVTQSQLAAGQISAGGIYLVAYDATNSKFQLVGASATSASGDNIFVFNASPSVTLSNSTAEDSDGGRESTIQWKGLQSGSEESTLVKIIGSHDGSSDDQKGKLQIYTNDGSDGDSPTLQVTIDSAGLCTLVGAASIGGALTVAGATQLNSTVTVGANDQGYDVILYGDTASANVTWDTSVDDLILNGAAGLIVPNGQLTLGSTAVTSTGAELNILDGVTASTAELNILDGVTSTTAEINILDGVTSTTAELNILDGVTSTTAELNILDGVTSTTAELNLVDGSGAGSIVNSKAVIYGSGGELNGTSMDITNVATASTFEPDGDTAAGDNAAIGYTSAEGLILTGQGSTSDVTIKNDADATVLSIPTGTTQVGIGTTTPSAELGFPIGNDVEISQVAVTAHQAGNAGYIGLTIADGGGHAGFFVNNSHDGTYSDQHLTFKTGEGGVSASTERMRITPNGKVGIGTTTPDSYTSDTLVISSGDQGGMTLVSADNVENYISWADGTSGGAQLQAGYIGYNHASNYMRFGTVATERMRILNDGKVGIGTTSPTAKLTVSSDIDVIGSNFANVEFTGASVNGSGVYTGLDSGGGYVVNVRDSGYIGFSTTNAERMRIDSSGNFLVGTTNTSLGIGNTNTGFQVENNGTFLASRADNVAGSLNRNNDGSILTVRRSGTEVGTIGVTASSTSYNTSSDYRLKENVNYTFDATTRLKQLKPARFNFIADSDNTVDGFLAHEVSSIVPEAITGEKDAVDENGDAVYQGIDQSKLVPLLVKTIQELEARITALEAE